MDSEKSLTNIHFYMDSEVCKWLFNKFGGTDKTNFTFSFGENDNYSYDVIDQPFHCELNIADEDVHFLLYIRSDFGIYQEEFANIHIVFHANGEKPSLIRQNGIGGDVSETFFYYYKAALQLRKEISASFYEGIADLNLEKEGVLVRLEGDDINFERVSGRKRPSLLCNSLFEGMHMGRPYTDELTSGLVREGLSIDEKVTLAEEGDEDCMEDVALTYLNGNDEVEQDFEKSAYWWEKLAETGNSQAQFNMGLFYAKGCGVTRDFEKASEWMKKALENGDDDARVPYEAYSSAADNLKKAEAGDANAQAEVAKLFTQIAGSLEQYGSGDDYKAAFEWAKKSADQGNTDALWTLALAYEHGRGVDEDKNKAIELYSKGAELNNPDAMNSFAAFISRGEVPGKTSKDAFELIKRAAEMGNVLAMRNLGHCYQFEEGTDHDMKKAIFWYEKYLEHENDAELAQKVTIFKTLPDLDENDDSEQDNDYARVDQSEFSKNLKKIEFKDKLFVLTGFDTAEENKITKIITDRGGIIKSSTVLKTDYLVVKGDYSSRKYERAVELKKQGKSIAIISVEQFYELVNKENKNNTENKNSKENNKSSKNNTFDDKMTFDLPRKYELVESKDDDGKPEYKISYNISLDADGSKQAEKSYTLKKYEKGKNLVGNVESNFNVGVDGFSKDFNIGLNISSTGLGGSGRSSQITYKIYSGVAIIDYEDKWYTILTTHVGTDDYESRSNAAEDIASELTTVLRFIIIDGKRLEIEPITKSFMISKLKTGDMDDINTLPLSPEEEAARIEREKKEEEEKREREKKEQEAKKEKERLEQEKREKELELYEESAKEKIHSTEEMTEYLKQVVSLETSLYTLVESSKSANGALKLQKPNKKRITKPSPAQEPSKPEQPIYLGNDRGYSAIFLATGIGSLIAFAGIIMYGISSGLLNVGIGIICVPLLVIGIVCLVRGIKGMIPKIKYKNEYRLEMAKYNSDLKEYEKTKKRIDDKNARDLDEYNRKVEAMKKEYQDNLLIAENNLEVAKKKVGTFGPVIEETEKTLQQLYNLDIIFPKYRNMVAACTFYEYFASGRVTQFGGPEGAYNLYESAVKQNIIRNNLETIKNEPAQIRQNQYVLYTELEKANKMLADVKKDVATIVSNSEKIESNTSDNAIATNISACVAEAQAKNAEALKYIAQIK